jgi:putative SOS response-associated peptidase YedK
MPASWSPQATTASPEPDPRELFITYPSEPMTMWPLSTRVNAPENDDVSLLDQVGERHP